MFTQNYFSKSTFLRNFAIKDGEFTPSRHKKETNFFVVLSIFRNFATTLFKDHKL